MNLLFIKGDSSLIANKLDTLIVHNNENFKELSNAIVATNKGSRFIEFISNDTLFTLIITTSVIFLVELSKSIIRNCTIKSQKKQLRSFIKFNLDEILPYIEKIEKNYLELADRATIDNGIHIIPAKLFMFDFKVVLNSDIKELYNSFKEKNEIINLVSRLDTVSETIINSEIYHNKIVTRIEKNLENIKIKYEEFLNSTSLFLEEIRRTYPDSYRQIDDFKFLNERLIYHYTKIAGARSISRFHKEILRPILEYIVDSKIYRENQNASKISSIGREFSNKYKELDSDINSYKEQFHLYSKLIKEQRNLLVRNINSINWN